MSNLRYTPRKRPHASDSCDDFSDSETEGVPAKRKKISGALRHNGQLLQRLKNFFIWMKELPVKQFFISVVGMGSPPDVIYVEEEKYDDEREKYDDATDSDSDRDLGKKPDKNIPLRSRVNHQNSFVTLPVNNPPFDDRKKFKEPRASVSDNNDYNMAKYQNPRYRFSGSTQNDFRSMLNNTSNPFQSTGAVNKIMSSKSNKEPSKPHMKKSTISMSSEIQVLFDSRTAETDDVEIVSEIASPKSVCPLSSYRSQHKKMTKAKSGAKFKHSSFTAHEVVKLQEKEQYKLLLEKYTSGPLYQPILKKAPVDAKTQKDSPSGSKNLSAFTKETLNQPVTNFLEKYMKPFQLLDTTSLIDDATSSKKVKAKPEVIYVDDDDDDDEPIVLQQDMSLPRLKPLPKSEHEVFSPEWIADLKISVNEDMKESMKIIKEQKRQIEEHRKKREELRAAEKQKREQLRIKGILLESFEEDVSADFCELTPEMEQAVDNALMIVEQNKVLSATGEFNILRKDIETLQGLNWLNDEVINYYLALIVDRSKLDNYPSVHSFNSFFYPNLKSKGFSSIRRWTRKIDIFSFDINLVPLHLGVHWCLAVIDHRSENIQYYDSMGGSEEQCLEILRDYLVKEKKDKKNQDLDPMSYSLEVMKDIPNQMNGSDCGMFTLKYAEYITRDAEITFTQKNMQYFRRRMVYEILKNQLL